MPINPDFIAYHKSLADEFNANKDQVRNLIGDAHWLSDGYHKEAILRRILQNKLPDTFRVSTGFFSDTVFPSNQIDILITDARKPTLFRNGDFLVVTPDCVNAIIEVKTELTGPKAIGETLRKLANNVRRVKQNNPTCWAGLFVYEGPKLDQPDFYPKSEIISKSMLKAVYNASDQIPQAAVNCISVGENIFVRYWPREIANWGDGQDDEWRSYAFDTGNHRSLSPAYFVGNLVMHLTGHDDAQARRAWFPIQDGHGKEDYRTHFIRMHEGRITAYQNPNV